VGWWDETKKRMGYSRWRKPRANQVLKFAEFCWKRPKVVVILLKSKNQ
jgi:hypothetical protein